ncbi:hypothetical protein F4776DRAFT_651137 [Hypoxylon sp. NC0597]|nr:hypothetical protein F4776DRAFT_651137 [Hypoxylon sp. NC0597]
MCPQVGGSQGFVNIAIARRYPSLSIVVQDVEPVIVAAEKDVPVDLADRDQVNDPRLPYWGSPCEELMCTYTPSGGYSTIGPISIV